MTSIRFLAVLLLLVSAIGIHGMMKDEQKKPGDECEMKAMTFVDVMYFYWKSDQFEKHRDYIMKRIRRTTKEELDQQEAKTGCTALHMATATADSEMAELLLKRGAYPNPQAHTIKTTPLSMLANPEKYDVYTRERFAYLLLKYDADGSIRQNRTLLCNKLLFTFPEKDMEDPHTNQKQLARPIKKTEKDPEFIAFLWRCWIGEKAAGGYWKSQFKEHREDIMTKIQTASKEELDQQDAVKGWSALHMAATKADCEMVELLLKQGACPNPQTYTSAATPLYILCDRRRYSDATRNKIGKLLLDHGADPTLKMDYPGARDNIPECTLREMRES